MTNNRKKPSNASNNKNKAKQKTIIKNTKKKEAGSQISINDRNKKAKYTDEEIARKQHADSKAKFIVRDRISNDVIDTTGKWIDVTDLDYDYHIDRKGKIQIDEIHSFNVELFDKTEIPVYQEDMSEAEKHQLTYEVAQEDIEKQKKEAKQQRKKVNRPKYHVDAELQKKGSKEEYIIKNVKKKK